MGWLAKKLRVHNIYIRLAFAEFLGTCILIIFGDGSVAQSVLSMSAKGGFLSINWSWCVAVMLGAYSCVNVSGGHINPAVSLAMACIGRLSWKKLPVYMLAQYLGAFTGAAVVYLVYFEAISNYDGGVRVVDPSNMTATAGIFATYPAGYLSVGEGLADQIVGTMMLVLALMSFTDRRNANIPVFLVPVVAGMTVLVIGTAYGLNCGYAINPARDLGPRLFTAIAGWGGEVFSYRNYNWFWVPIVGPHIGAILGSLIYLLLVEIHWPVEHDLTYHEDCDEQNKGMNRSHSTNNTGEDNEGLVY